MVEPMVVKTVSKMIVSVEKLNLYEGFVAISSSFWQEAKRMINPITIRKLCMILLLIFNPIPEKICAKIMIHECKYVMF